MLLYDMTTDGRLTALCVQTPAVAEVSVPGFNTGLISVYNQCFDCGGYTR